MVPFLEELKKRWEEVPDMRFGQLMTNLKDFRGDIFYLEEDQFIEELDKFIEILKES